MGWKSCILFPTGAEICFVLHLDISVGFWNSHTLRTGDNYRRIRPKGHDSDPSGSRAEVYNALIVTPCPAYTFMSCWLSAVNSCFASAPHCMSMKCTSVGDFRKYSTASRRISQLRRVAPPSVCPTDFSFIELFMFI